MRWVLFLSRIAFICGFCFLITLVLAMLPQEFNEPFIRTIVVIGYFMGMIVVPFTLIVYLVLKICGKKVRQIVPTWLIIANIFFFLILIYYIFYLNDPYYHQK